MYMKKIVMNFEPSHYREAASLFWNYSWANNLRAFIISGVLSIILLLSLIFLLASKAEATKMVVTSSLFGITIISFFRIVYKLRMKRKTFFEIVDKIILRFDALNSKEIVVQYGENGLLIDEGITPKHYMPWDSFDYLIKTEDYLMFIRRGQWLMHIVYRNQVPLLHFQDLYKVAQKKLLVEELRTK